MQQILEQLGISILTMGAKPIGGWFEKDPTGFIAGFD
jgi:hypothetical protein